MTEPTSEATPPGKSSAKYRPAGLVAATVVVVVIAAGSWLTGPKSSEIKTAEAASVPQASQTVSETEVGPASAPVEGAYDPGAATAPAAPETQTAETAPATDAPPSAAAATTTVELPLLHIENQNDKFFVRKPGARGVAVVMVGFEMRNDSDLWTRGFKVNIPENIQLALVMNLKGKSKMTGGMLKSMMRLDVGDEPIEIYLDWEGEMAAAYGIDPTRAAAYTIGPDDRLLEVAYDTRDEVKLRRLLESVGFTGEIKYQPDDPVMGTQAK